MRQINKITSDYHQEFYFGFDFGDITLKLYYSDNLLGWFFSLKYGDFECQNLRLVNHPNLLNQWNLILPFGLRCETKNGYDALSRFDFEDGNASLYFLDEQEVNDVQNYELRYYDE